MLIAHVLLLICNRKHLQNLCQVYVSSDFARLESSVDNSVWEILQEMLYKTCITDLKLSTTPLKNDCRNGDMIQLCPLCPQLLFQFVQITDAYFVHIFFQYMQYAVINWIQIWQIWGPQLRWNKFWSFFLQQFNSSTCPMSISSF